MKAEFSAVIAREVHKIPISIALMKLQSKRILVTGAAGAVGRPLVRALREGGVRIVPTDLEPAAGEWGTSFMDVTDFLSILQCVTFFDPDLIVNLAAAKLAPAGEVDPWRAVQVNTVGVQNLLNMGRPLVQASTCKAIAACTAYGASKLIAERLVLNAGGTVIRYYNIPTCGPSVPTLWQALPEDDPIPVTPCTRYLISEDEAVALTLWGCALPTGKRYALNPGSPVTMSEYAAALYPGRRQRIIHPRRGDRIAEPLDGEQESRIATDVPYVYQVISHHD